MVLNSKEIKNVYRVILINAVLFCFFGCFSMAVAQTAPGKYWIQFTDKNNSPFSVSAPEEFLSQRAIDRRTRMGISVIENDIPVNENYMDSLRSLGLVVLTKSKWFNAVTVATTDIALMDTIQSISFVAGTNKVMKSTNSICDRELFQPTTYRGLKQTKSSDYGDAATQIEMLNGQFLHDFGYRGEGMQIAIIDAGFSFANTHPAFDSINTGGQILGTKDFVDGDDYVYAHHTHGMNVLSTIAANVPGTMIGTAPGAMFWLLRSEDTSSEYRIEEDNWIAAAEFADSVGVDIINSSLGYNTFTDNTQDYSWADLDGNTARITIGADIAASKGILVVSSAGNDGSTGWHYINVPSDGDSVFAIGAVDGTGAYASLSSTGPTADGRIKPDVAAMGKNTLVANADSNYIFGSGTSFSSPIIAGMAACLWQAHPELTNIELMDVIRESASQYNNPDSLLGYGIPDFYSAFMVLQTIKVQQKVNSDLVNVFPNPFKEHVYLDFYSADSQEVYVELFDLMGRTMYTDKLLVNKSQCTRLMIPGKITGAESMCILRITAKNEVFEYKLIRSGN